MKTKFFVSIFLVIFVVVLYFWPYERQFGHSRIGRCRGELIKLKREIYANPEVAESLHHYLLGELKNSQTRIINSQVFF